MSFDFRARGIAIGAWVLTLFVFFSATLDAQVEKRVVFAKGKSSATLQGKLPQKYADYDAYVIRARRGQTLSVKLITSDPNAYITVYETKQLGPDEDMISGSDQEYPRDWSGSLPITSEYSVQVYGVRSLDERSSRATYTLQLSIR